MADPIRLGIFGWPVAHSKSPEMHEAAASALGIDLVYERFGVPPESLVDAVREKHIDEIDGYNLTVPHKEAIMPLLDEVSSVARAIGAVNTVVRDQERYVGHNTDAPGFVRSLEEAGVECKAARAVVVGAGGAARAAVVGLAGAGAEAIAVVARRPEQAEELVRSLEPHVECPLHAAPLGGDPSCFATATLLVQATSATLEATPAAVALAEALPLDRMPDGAAVVDMVYEPLVTEVLARAQRFGLRTVDGLGMLLHQGAIAFEMWTGFEPPIDVMRAALSK